MPRRRVLTTSTQTNSLRYKAQFMKILFSLTYYYPHISGLTIYAQRLAEALAARGHQVTVLTSQHDPALPREDEHQGVRIVRVPVTFRIGKPCRDPNGTAVQHLVSSVTG